MKRSTAHILAALKTLIEAATPPTSTGADDDLYRVQIGDRFSQTGGRVVLINATAGRRKPTGGATCVDWESSVTVTNLLADIPTADDEWTATQVAIDDQEAILAAILNWSIVTDGIVSVDADEAQPSMTGDNMVSYVRNVNIRYLRSEV